MASKKSGRLAGLAALAGLAYMATRDKGGTKAAAPAAKDARTYAEVHEGEDAQAGINMGTSAGRKMGEEMLARGEAAKKPAADLGAIRDEAGTLSRFRRNTETGELYDSGVTDGGESAAKLQSAADRRDRINANVNDPGYSAGMKKGGKVKKMASGGMTASASKRGDGIAQRGKTRGKMC
jgi:hypothetical protein